MKAHRYPCRRHRHLRIQTDVQSRLGKTVTIGRQFTWLKHANFYDCHLSLAADAKAASKQKLEEYQQNRFILTLFVQSIGALLISTYTLLVQSACVRKLDI